LLFVRWGLAIVEKADSLALPILFKCFVDHFNRGGAVVPCGMAQ
jgi:hypothetical protein